MVSSRNLKNKNQNKGTLTIVNYADVCRYMEQAKADAEAEEARKHSTEGLLEQIKELLEKKSK